MTDSTLHVLAISGSLRRGSYNTALLCAAADIAPESMKIDIYPIGDLPLFDADLEAAGSPEPVTRFRTAVAEADALLLATPEYNWSTTGALKNAIDWASRGGAEAREPARIGEDEQRHDPDQREVADLEELGVDGVEAHQHQRRRPG